MRLTFSSVAKRRPAGKESLDILFRYEFSSGLSAWAHGIYYPETDKLMLTAEDAVCSWSAFAKTAEKSKAKIYWADCDYLWQNKTEVFE